MGSVLGLDYGTRRIGIAGSDSTRLIATALGCHREPEDGSVLAHLARLVRERDVDTFVVGLPLTADGRSGPIADRARRFAERLEQEFGLPVVLVDERYSSQEADRWLAGRRRAKGERDAAAAALILQQFLDGAAGREA